MVAICVSLAVAVAIGLPASALGQSTTVPPGQSEADQYFETVPGGSGNKSLDGTKGPREVLTDEQIAALGNLGEEGTAAAQLAAATAPGGAGAGSVDGGDEGGADAAGPSTGFVAPSREGLGPWLWLIVIGTVVAIATYVLVDRRMRPAP